MGINIDGPEITIKASGDLSSYQFHIMTLDTDGKAKLATDPDGTSEALIGILQNKPDAEDEPAVIRIAGVSKVMGGESVDEGKWLSCGTDGHADAAEAFDNVIGISLDAVVDGEINRVILALGCAGYPA